MKIVGTKPFPYLNCEVCDFEQFQPGVEVEIIDLIYTQKEFNFDGDEPRAGCKGYSLCTLNDTLVLFRNQYWDTHIKIITMN